MILMTEERATWKKIVVALSLAIMLLVLCFVLQGCMMEQVQADSNAAGVFRYVRVPLGYILVDQHTGVMYWMSFDEYRNTYSAITLLVNPDGTPKVWDGDLQ